MEPLHKGPAILSFIEIEVVHSSEIQSVLTIWENEHCDHGVCPLGPWNVSFGTLECVLWDLGMCPFREVINLSVGGWL